MCAGLVAWLAVQEIGTEGRGRSAVALVDGTVVAIDGGPALQNAVVLIEGDRISKVGAAGTVSVPPNAKAEGAALTLTAVSGDDAIEVTAHLD